MIQPQQSDPIDAALDYHSNIFTYVEEVRAAEAEAQEERAIEAEVVARSSDRGVSVTSLPSLLLTIRSEESGGGIPGAYNYSAYNATGCEGYGCGGAYQMHGLYASTWAERAGYPGLGGNAATWSPQVQDAVALDLFYSTNPDGAHWCDWTDYC